MCILTGSVSLSVFFVHALTNVTDPPLLFKPEPSHSRMRLPMSPSHSTRLPDPPKSLLPSHRSSSSLSIPLSISSESGRFSQNGTWTSSNQAANLGKNHIPISGNSTQECRNGSRICRKAHYPPSSPSSSSSCCIATCTFSRQAPGFLTYMNMLNA